jgi:septum formation protein
VLASASPRRRTLLGSLGLVFAVDPADVPEVQAPGEDAADFVRRAAADKAAAVAARRPGAVVLAADTDVVLDGVALGKPRDEAEARATLAALSGRRHLVLGGVAVRGPAGFEAFVVRTAVAFRPLTSREIDWYVATGEPLDKAGSYAIQGQGGVFVAGIEGSHSNVIGLPLAETVAALARAGVELPWGRP